MARPKVFQIPAALDSIHPMKDGGMSILFHTKEMETKDKTKLMGFYLDYGFLQFSSQELHTVPVGLPTRETGVKTPSQRLRAVLAVLHRQKYPDIPFEVFYEQQMERIINKAKESLT